MVIIIQNHRLNLKMDIKKVTSMIIIKDFLNKCEYCLLAIYTILSKQNIRLL